MDISRRNFIAGGLSIAAVSGISSFLPGCKQNEITKSGLKISDFESKGVGEFKTGLQDTFSANIPTKLCVLNNKNGCEACITNLGARLVSLMIPDKDGNFKDMMLGFDNIKDYADADNKLNVFGAVVGPVIGRISNASFTLNGQKYNLEKNVNNKHNLHSGKTGWQYQTWNIIEQNSNSVCFELIAPDMDNGFPGERTANIKYTLTDNNELQIDYKVTSTKATPINISSHAYFNLEGNPNNDIYSYKIQINSDKLGLINADVNPTGEIITIPKDSELDFYTAPKNLNSNFDINSEYFKNSKGYDHAFVFNKDFKLKTSAYCPASGIKMDVITDRPVINIYDAHDLDNTITGKNNIAYGKCCGICVEAQAHADAVNQPNFPSVIINPGEEFKSTTIYKFSIK